MGRISLVKTAHQLSTPELFPKKIKRRIENERKKTRRGKLRAKRGNKKRENECSISRRKIPMAQLNHEKAIPRKLIVVHKKFVQKNSWETIWPETKNKLHKLASHSTDYHFRSNDNLMKSIIIVILDESFYSCMTYTYFSGTIYLTKRQFCEAFAEQKYFTNLEQLVLEYP